MSENNNHKVYLRNGFAVAVGKGAVPKDNGEFYSVDRTHRDREKLFVRIFNPDSASSFYSRDFNIVVCAGPKEVANYIQGVAEAEPHPLAKNTTPEAARSFFGPSVEIIR